ncbi:hypothetical protein EFK50_07865 [Nocardioides marmoriginsengisoli]|uniref:Uncharacterized protein n=1 Tax=Nocardioides marmoriginsengisoli TaxID=661483 RepID=A0A3N0CJM1_9ACTN|nr:hypothetical protein [Nocardioides marmoriginsengisoli]RNL63650.1 hypothetical protein EFK50_07865 [Nocardioides marmoriginsengisoli]
MSKTLAELRAQSGPMPLPKATLTVTLIEGQHLLDDAQRLDQERSDLLAAGRRTDDEGKPTGPPAKAGVGAKESKDRNARLDSIASELDVVGVSLADHQGEIGLQGLSGGDWQRFKDDNPPRLDNAADVRLTGGYCNATAVFNDLARYVVSWNGEPVPEGDWDSYLAERITYSDRRDMITVVVGMHEQGLARAPKLPSSSSQTENSGND